MNTQSVNPANDFANLKVRDLVVQNFHAAELFEKLGIDFCCKGNKNLKEALTEKQIPEKIFIEELNKVNYSSAGETERYSEWDLNFLAQYIVNNHHGYVRNAVPQISAHLQKVFNAHGEKYPYIKEVQNEFAAIAEELMSHMMKEERVLFPLIKYLVDSKNFNEKPKNGGYGTIQNPINQMEREHVSAGNSLQKIRELTSDFNLPQDACTTFRLTYQELEEFEADLHKHIHLENNILFPRAIELETGLMAETK